MRRAIFWVLLCLVLVPTGGCVTRGTYEAVRADLDAVKADLDRDKAQSQILSQQISDLEQLKVDMEKKWTEANAELEYTKKTVESEMAARQERVDKLARMVSQLTAQQTFLRGAMQRAEQERPALQSTVDMYRKKLESGEGLRASALSSEMAQSQDLSGASATSQPPTSVPMNSQAAAVASPAQVTVDQSAAAEPAKSAVTPQPEPTDEGWLSTITGWLKSIWRSFFS